MRTALMPRFQYSGSPSSALSLIQFLCARWKCLSLSAWQRVAPLCVGCESL